MNPETIILDGRALSKKINSYIKSEIESLSLNEPQQKSSLKPGLCVVIVGDREDSKTYVSMKSKKVISLEFFIFNLLLISRQVAIKYFGLHYQSQ